MQVGLSEKWNERGIILRTIEQIFLDYSEGVFSEGTELSFTFIEIYNENVYDLFNSESASSKKTKTDNKVM